METFYLGDADELFGAYLPSQQLKSDNRQVLILNGLGQDYFRSHFVLQRLARKLSQHGCHVLRFDYGGTGDSLGSDADYTLESCLTNASCAARELAEISGQGKLIVIGLRVGANLALRLGKSVAIECAVLWDPVVDGGRHLQQLVELDSRVRRDRNRFLRPRSEERSLPRELVGFRVNDQLLDELASIRLEQDLDGAEDTQIGLMTCGDADKIKSVVESEDRTVSFQITRLDDHWNELRTLELAMLPSPDIEALCSAIDTLV